MALLLETSLGDITIDLDIDGSPSLCYNLLKLAKARYFTSTLVYNIQPGRFCQLGDPCGDGSGGNSIFGIIRENENKNKDKDTNTNTKDDSAFFIEAKGRPLTKQELCEKGRVVAVEMGMGMGIGGGIGSQFMITIDAGEGKALDDMASGAHRYGGDFTTGAAAQTNQDQEYFSLGFVSEDENDVLGKINGLYCDKHGRPYADVRIIKAHILDDPYLDDPKGMEELMVKRGITLMGSEDLPQEYRKCFRWIASSSPSYKRPKEEIVEVRISTEDALADFDEETERKRRKERTLKEDKSNAVMLEMLGDISSADAKPPENVLFVCKLNPVTDEEDLQLIFSRFDPNAKAEIIRDRETGDSLQFAFVEFDTEKACNEAYFKMNNALIDDRRIKVDFSQSVAKLYNKHAHRRRKPIASQSKEHPHSHNRGNRRSAVQADSTHRSNSRRRVERYPPPPRDHYSSQHGNQNYNQNDRHSDRRRDRSRDESTRGDRYDSRKERDASVRSRSDSESRDNDRKRKSRHREKDKKHSRHRHKSRSRNERDGGRRKHRDESYDRHDRKRDRHDRHRKKHRKRRSRSRSRSRSHGRR